MMEVVSNDPVPQRKGGLFLEGTMGTSTCDWP